MLNSDHSHCGTSDDRKRRVMTTAFKYNKLLSYLGWDESTQDSKSVNCATKKKKRLRNRQLIWWKIKRINTGVFLTSAHLRMLFSMHVSMEIVKPYVVFLTLLLLREPKGTTWGGFIPLILITLITHYWLCAKNSEWSCIFLSQNNGIEITLNETHPRIRRRDQISHDGN